MSYDHQQIVLSQSKTKGPQRLLLMVLAFHANKDTGLCCPNHKTLADEAGMSEPTVKRVVGQLKESGEVLVSDGRGRGKGNHYIITLGRSIESVRQEVDDYGGKGINFDTFKWEEKVSEVIPYNEEKVSDLSIKGINSDTLRPVKGINFERKGINSDTSMLTKNNMDSTTTTTIPAAGENPSTPPQDDTQLKAALQTCGELYETYFGSLEDPLCRQDFIQTLRDYGPGAVEGAVRVAIVERANGKTKTWGYVKSILEGEHNGQNGQTKTRRGKQETNGAAPGTGHQNGRGAGSHRNTRGRRGRTGRDDSGGLLGDVGPGGNPSGYQWIYDILDQPDNLGEL